MQKKSWNSIRGKLTDRQKLSSDWDSTVSIFENRIINRYFNTLRYVIEREGKSTGEGFPILTLQCSLIEFLATLQEGMIYRYEADKKKSYYYSKSAKWYNKFLNSAEIFSGYFHGEEAFLQANDFYKNVRCALIHEARTRKGWTVNIYQKSKEQDKVNRIVFEDKKIYRTALNNVLEEYFTSFCLVAKEENKQGRKYRKFIARKLDVINEIEPDDCFWW